MTARPRTIALAMLVLITLFGTPALAQDDESPEYQRMLQLSDEATIAVLDGNFEAGAITFRAAYRAYPDPVLLKNEMIAWYRAGDCHSALPPARNFLQSEKALPEDIADVRTVERDCHLQLGEEALKDDDLALADYHLDRLGALELPAESEQRLDALRTQYAARVLTNSDPINRSEDAGWSPPPTPALALFGGGAAGAITGLSLHIIALQRQNELNSLSNSTDPNDARRLRQRRAAWDGYQRASRWLVPTLYTLSAAAIGAGIYITLTETSGDASARAHAVTFAPVLRTGFAGAHLSGAF
ncbi:hypothetical protein EA187_09535 [Lujinxingia sediminis]|uniref:Tetratricopeptide repeat protein n=1 Tax=Lujinxingia sediminis TaxID=2480984 RepID=A0ABY0CT43_9DELT|nr:hypothetical protein [Lujinxingia sediminis]RVU44772.1 hypothetical protein EA187_09535 [Lujinxingia sediminis]